MKFLPMAPRRKKAITSSGPSPVPRALLVAVGFMVSLHLSWIRNGFCCVGSSHGRKGRMHSGGCSRGSRATDVPWPRGAAVCWAAPGCKVPLPSLLKLSLRALFPRVIGKRFCLPSLSDQRERYRFTKHPVSQQLCLALTFPPEVWDWDP